MKPFADEKYAGIEQARNAAVSTEPYRVAQASSTPSQARPAAAVIPHDVKVQWSAMIARVRALPAEREKVAQAVVARMLRTRAGQQLVRDIFSALQRKNRPPVQIAVHFRDKRNFPEAAHRDGASGYFFPREAGESEYSLYIDWQSDDPNAFLSRLSGIQTNLKQGASFMTETLFHELLHIWFIHIHDSGTGHGAFDDVSNRYEFIDEDFEQRLRDLIRELETLENLI